VAVNESRVNPDRFIFDARGWRMVPSLLVSGKRVFRSQAWFGGADIQESIPRPMVPDHSTILNSRIWIGQWQVSDSGSRELIVDLGAFQGAVKRRSSVFEMP
jgi:hypothetical protein